MIVQKIKTTDSSDFDKARKYFNVLSALNNLHLSNLALNLLAFMATKPGESKEDFCKEFDSSIASVNNTVHQLKKKNLLVKTEYKVLINKQLNLDFSKPVVLQITLNGSERKNI